jgi:hypothetical protein
VTSSTPAPFGHLIDSRTGDQIRPATSQEWANHAQGRRDSAHFYATIDGEQRLVFCDGPASRTSEINAALAG